MKSKNEIWRYDIDYLVWNQPCACYVQKRLSTTSRYRFTKDDVLAAVQQHTQAEWGTDDAKLIGWEVSPTQSSIH